MRSFLALFVITLGCGGNSGSPITADSGVHSDADPCDTTICNSPPADLCVGPTTLRSFAGAGTCSHGECSYQATDSECPAVANGQPACSNAQCGAICDDNYESCQTGCCYRFAVQQFAVNTSPSTCHSVWGDFAGNIYAACAYYSAGAQRYLAQVKHTTGNGLWDDAFLDFVPAATYGIWGSAPNDIYIVESGGVISHSTDGTNWTYQTSGTTHDLLALWGSSASDVYAVGSGGVILHSTGNGTWTAQTSGTTQPLRAMWGSGPNDVYAVGDVGTILHSTGNGTWTAQTSGGTASLYSLWGSSAGDVYAVGIGATLHSAGDGHWTLQSSQGAHGVWGTSATDIYTVGANGLIRHSTGDGTWTAMPAVPNTGSLTFSGIWGTSSNDIWIVDEDAFGLVVHGS
jgi:hypothetical protein